MLKRIATIIILGAATYCTMRAVQSAQQSRDQFAAIQCVREAIAADKDPAICPNSATAAGKK